MRPQRDQVSEFLLFSLSVLMGLLFFVCPGWFFLFFLPLWIGLPAALACACCGPLMMWKVDEAVYGKRDHD